MLEKKLEHTDLILNGFLQNLPKYMIFPNNPIIKNSLFHLNKDTDLSEKC